MKQGSMQLIPFKGNETEFIVNNVELVGSDVFTLVDVENNEIKEISILKNQEHVQGGCMVPVNLLSENHVNALIVGGIGMRPLMGFKQVGIHVYHDDLRPEIGPVVKDLIEGKLTEIRNDQVCGGGH